MRAMIFRVWWKSREQANTLGEENPSSKTPETLSLVDIELHPRRFCLQHKNHLESTPIPAKVSIVHKLTGWIFFLIDQLLHFPCMLVCLDSIHTLEIITRILCEVVNRERLYGTTAFPCMLVCWDFIDTLEIITRILCEVVNRERLCNTACMLVCWDSVALWRFFFMRSSHALYVKW